ncbi:MAG: CinA family protein [Alphaproteobacteria bacterium]
MKQLLPLAEKAGALLKERGETIAVAESSAGGLISAALLAVPGASAYFLGGAVVYTYASRTALLAVTKEELAGIRPATEAYALLLARRVLQRLSANWGLAETGATGPSGNRYGDAAGHACLAVVGAIERTVTLETGKTDRLANMRAFAATALELLTQSLAR